MVKRIIKLFLCLCMMTLLVACGRKEPDNEYVGNWNCGRVEQISSDSLDGKEVKIDVTQAAGTESTIVVKNNGKAKIMLRSDFANVTISGDWEYDTDHPSELIVRGSDGSEVIIHSGSDGTIYVDDGAEIVVDRYTFWKSE